jgi:hypothetical protein
MMKLTREETVLLRGYLFAVLVYVAGHVALWFLMYRPRRLAGELGAPVWAVMAVMWITFIVVAGRLALTHHRQPEIAAALVSSAAVLTAGLARTAMAALGMREFLWWDHDNVVFEAALEQVFIAVLCFFPAVAVAAASRLLFGRRRGAGSEPR